MKMVEKTVEHIDFEQLYNQLHGGIGLKNWPEAFAVIRNILFQAGELLLRPIQLEIKCKNQYDFVTQTDVAVQKQIKQALAESFPQVGFMGEEDGACHALNVPTWILDPVDGTTNYIFDRRHSCISLAYFDGTAMRAGMIYDPYAGELFHTIKDGGSYCNESKMAVRSETDYHKMLLLASAGASDKQISWLQLDLLRDLHQDIVDIRICGSAALNFAYLACGRGSAFISTPMYPWDGAAGALMVKEAGGVVRDYEGKEVDLASSTSTVAGNTVLVSWLQEHIHQVKYEELRKLCRR